MLTKKIYQFFKNKKFNCSQANNYINSNKIGDLIMGISLPQVLIILLIIVILFGAGKIPRVMGDVAKGIKSFKAGMKEGENEEIDASAEEIESGKKTKKTKTAASRKKKN